MTREELIRRAIKTLAPNADYVQRGEAIEWNDVQTSQPTAEQLDAEIARQQMLMYRDARAAEYPSIGDQLDALWKGGEAAADMLARIQAVKYKYPKGE